MKNKVLPVILLLAAFTHLQAQTVIPLYAGKAPGSENWNWAQQETANNPYHVKVLYNISEPALVAYLPAPSTAVGTAVIIAPGGGFHMVGVDYEAAEIAKWLNSKGITAFVLRYRLLHGQTNDPFAEAQATFLDKAKVDKLIAPVADLAIADGLKAVEYVRTHAQQLNISPKRVGMMGFSAGGTVTMGTVYRANDANRPDFAAVMYPYLGYFKKEVLPAAAPPLFICTASDDGLGFAPSSSRLYESWIAAKKPAELHLYEKGDHGFGSRKQNLPVDSWTDRLEDWLDNHGWLWPDKPTGFFATFTPAQAKQLRKDEADRLKTDWAYLKRYADENSQLPAPKPGEKRVVFLGSSRIENWKRFDGPFFEQNHYLNRGVSGQTTPQMLLRFRQDVINLKPAVMVFSGGSNDIAQNTGPTKLEAIAGNVETMILLAKAAGIKVVLCSELPAYVYPWRPELQPAEQIVALNQLYKALATKHNVDYAEVYSALVDARKGLKKEYQSDEVHPNQAGYRAIEPLVQKAIAAALAR